MDNTSSRQNIIEYFDTLQIEYLLSEIRRKIYTSSSDKRHYDKVMKLKEDKIKDISSKNTFKSIFNSDEKRQEYIARIYPVMGLPKFGRHLKSLDIFNYYSRNSIIKVYDKEDSHVDDFRIGIIQEYIHKDSKILYIEQGKEEIQESKCCLIARIL